jgi:hypothetical protein
MSTVMSTVEYSDDEYSVMNTAMRTVMNSDEYSDTV